MKLSGHKGPRTAQNWLDPLELVSMLGQSEHKDTMKIGWVLKLSEDVGMVGTRKNMAARLGPA